ncbi:helix-turn-helix transcriptional regulator [Halorientalis salina]|uniref:helix-turn-helix transcriptional regulator n=1 Tax=Halorientalis salina TaxID=2932266 RepID=UPI0010ACED6B|nr:hypothetical protein [Halorientalis salina]
MLSRARVALLALLLVLVTAGQAGGVAVAGQSPVADRPAQTSDAATPQPSETTFRVQLQPNGSARWTVLMNFSLGTDVRRDAFETFAAQFEARTDSRTERAFRQASRQASNATGRQMSITDVERTTRTTNGTGQLVLRFTWTNFSRQTDASLHVDDVFNTTSGTWFRELDSDQSLVIVPPTGYSLVDAAPPGYAVSNGSLRWDGERTFAPGDISVTYEEVDNGASPPAPPLLAAALVLAGFGVVAVLAYLFSNSELAVPTPLAARTDGDGSDDDRDDGGAATGNPAPGTVSTPPDGDGQPDAADDGVDEELLSDEERIERLLDQNGGRMKQANIVTETGWSNAKVSQLLSAMDEDDRIDKLRIGRENLISFPDEDITDTNGDEP